MNILHVSDIHYRQQYAAQTEGYQGMLGRMQSPMIPLTTCIERAKEKHTIDLLIVSGDLTEDGSPEDYAYLKQNLRDMLGEIPILVTLGNHDIKANFRQGWCQSAIESSPYNQVFDAGEFRIICFDNSCHGFADGVVDERQFLWLKEILGEEDGKPVLFVTHHHLLKGQASTSAWPGANRLLDLLGKIFVRYYVDIHIMLIQVQLEGYPILRLQVCRLSEKTKGTASSALKNDMGIIYTRLQPEN